MDRTQLITKFFKEDYQVGATIILRDLEGTGENRLSLPSTPGSSGTIHVDSSIYHATYRTYNGGLPLRETVRWVVDDEYVLFYHIDKEIKNVPNWTYGDPCTRHNPDLR